MQGSGDVIGYLLIQLLLDTFTLQLINYLIPFMKVIIDIGFIPLLPTWINVFFHTCYLMWGFNTFTSHQ
jgi:hypothetical protein